MLEKIDLSGFFETAMEDFETNGTTGYFPPACHQAFFEFCKRLRDHFGTFDIRVDSGDGLYSTAIVVEDAMPEGASAFYCCPVDYDYDGLLDGLSYASFMSDQYYTTTDNSAFRFQFDNIDKKSSFVTLWVTSFNVGCYIDSAYLFDNGACISFGCTGTSSSDFTTTIVFWKDSNNQIYFTESVVGTGYDITPVKMTSTEVQPLKLMPCGLPYNFSADFGREYFCKTVLMKGGSTTEPTYLVPIIRQHASENGETPPIFLPIHKGYTAINDVFGHSNPCLMHKVDIDGRKYLVSDFLAVAVNE